MTTIQGRLSACGPARLSGAWAATAFAASLSLALVACGGSGKDHAAETTQLTCDDSITANFKPDAHTTVLLVKAFKKGDPLVLSGAATAQTPKAANALCLVKLLVGPGNPGPVNAPSTSPGIGIEVWLPAKSAWNGRVHAVGGGGWAGTEEADTTAISSATNSGDIRFPADIAGQDGSVSSSTDTGHSGSPPSLQASFAVNPDGSINTTLWNDFASRAIHEQAVKTKALAQAYYGTAPKFSYWDGGSTGGRQALKLAQAHPGDFDGILAGYPAINWTKFITAELYPQIVIHQDLGGNYMSLEQLDLVSNAAISACDIVGGKHLGFVLDPASCRYDPTKDAKVLCVGSGGTNGTSACVTQPQALAINKIWYGMTSDGSVPDPAIDNGFGPIEGVHRWYGLTRGTSLALLATPAVFPIASEMVAFELQDYRIASTLFTNATGNGADAWKTLSYAQLNNAYDAGIALQSQFGFINTDDPDLTAFKARGGKLIHYAGMADPLIPPQGSRQYYERVLATMGGPVPVQEFYRYYEYAGMGHGPMNQTSNHGASPPMPHPAAGDLHKLLVEWVEHGRAPEGIVASSVPGAPEEISLPVCAYPLKTTYTSGDAYLAASYVCR